MSNGSLATSLPDEDRQGWSVSGIENSAFVRTIYGLIAIVGMTGNALVCFVLVRIPSLRTRTSQFIINLSITDFLTSFMVIPFHLFPNPPPVPSGLAGELMCRLITSKYIMWVTVITSVYSLVAVTMERYFAVVHPIRYKILYTTRFTVIVALGCWLVGLVSTSFFFFIYDVVDGVCTFVPYPSHVHQKIVGVYIFFVIYFFPISVSLIWHGKIIRSLKRQATALERRGLQAGPQAAGQNKEQWQLKAAHDIQKMFLVVILTFMICWAPNQFMFLAYNFGAPVDFSKQYYHFSVIIAVCNSCVNPFIYVFKNKPFRLGVLEAIRCSSSMRRWANGVHPLPSGSTNAAVVSAGTVSTNA